MRAVDALVTPFENKHHLSMSKADDLHGK